MDAAALREAQRPLKERYRADPDSASAALHASADFADDGITCTIDTWAGRVRAGLHAATGGDGRDACSGDMLLEALLACTGVTLRSVATALGIELRAATLRASAKFDARGTLGMSRDVPVGIADVQVTAELDTDADDAALARLTELTERYCVVAQSLRESPALRISRR